MTSPTIARLIVITLNLITSNFGRWILRVSNSRSECINIPSCVFATSISPPRMCPHRRWSPGLRSLRRGGWRCRGSRSSPPAWSSWPSWPRRWLRWQLPPPPLSGLERGGRRDETEHLQTTHYMSAGAEPLHLQKPCEKAALARKKTQRKRTFEIIKQWIISYTTGNKSLWDHSLVFHLLTGGIFTAGCHADGMDPCVCVRVFFLNVTHCSTTVMYLYNLMGIDAVRITAHDATLRTQ